MGSNSSRATKIIVSLGTGVGGAVLAGAWGVQTAMQKLTNAKGNLGEELREMERLRKLLRRRGLEDEKRNTAIDPTLDFHQEEAAEAERDRLSRLFYLRFKRPEKKNDNAVED